MAGPGQGTGGGAAKHRNGQIRSPLALRRDSFRPDRLVFAGVGQWPGKGAPAAEVASSGGGLLRVESGSRNAVATRSGFGANQKPATFHSSFRLAPTPDLPALATERGGPALSGSSARFRWAERKMMVTFGSNTRRSILQRCRPRSPDTSSGGGILICNRPNKSRVLQ